MFTTQRRRLRRWLSGSRPGPGPRDETVPMRLTARQVAKRIRDHLAGRSSRAELSAWAASQFVRQDFGRWFEPAQAKLLKDSLGTMIAVDEAVDEAADRAFLGRLAHLLEAEP